LSKTNPTKNDGDLKCSGRAGSCSTSGTGCVTIITNSVISHERGQDDYDKRNISMVICDDTGVAWQQEDVNVTTTNETYQWSSVTTQVLRGNSRYTAVS